MAVQHGHLHERGPGPAIDINGLFKVTKTQRLLLSGDYTLVKTHLQSSGNKSPHILHTGPLNNQMLFTNNNIEQLNSLMVQQKQKYRLLLYRELRSCHHWLATALIAVVSQGLLYLIF